MFAAILWKSNFKLTSFWCIYVVRRLFTNKGFFYLLKILGNVCGAKKLVGPKGKITSPNFPNSYNNNDYCRWKIAVANNLKASLNIKTLKTVNSSDHLELYDGVSGSFLTVLSGFIANPIRVTSDSNILDVKFVSDRLNVADGFQAEYDGASERLVFIFLLMLPLQTSYCTITFTRIV